MEMLSPGVYVHEEDRSQIVASSSSSVGVFGGDFVKGPIGAYKLINTVDELENYYGKPTSANQNDWYQVYNYLTYASQIYVARAGNVNGKETELSNCKIKKIGKTIPAIPGKHATSKIATAVAEGSAGNNIVVSVSTGKPIVTSAGTYAQNTFAKAKEVGANGNKLSIKTELAGNTIISEGVKATSAVGEAVHEGANGNKLTVEIAKTGVSEISAAVAARSSVGTVKTAGSAGNSISVVITKLSTGVQTAVKADSIWGTAKVAGTLGNEYKIKVAPVQDSENTYTISVWNGTSYQVINDNFVGTAFDDTLVSDIIDFKVGANLFEGEIQLAGGIDASGTETYSVVTKNDSATVDTQSSVTSVSDVHDNDYVKFTLSTLEAGTYKFAGGVDAVNTDVFSVTTKNDGVQVDKQENIVNAGRVDSNDYVKFTLSNLVAGTYTFTGGVDAVVKNTYSITTLSGSEVVDTQNGIQTSADLTPNDYVTFKSFETFKVGTAKLEGGKDEVTENTFDVSTFDTTKPFDVIKQTSVRNYNQLMANTLVRFDKTDVELQTGDFKLTGGVDGYAGGLDLSKIYVTNLKDIIVDTLLRFEHNGDLYKVVALDNANFEITLDRPLPEDPDYQPVLDSYPLTVEVVLNGSAEAVSSENTTVVTYKDENNKPNYLKVPNPVSAEDLFEYTQKEIITNDTVFDDNYDSIGFTSPKSKVKFISRNPGKWSKNIKICIARPESFELNDISENHVPRYAFTGILVDDFFEYAPKDGQVAVLIYDEESGQVVETYIASFDKDAKDSNNKSMYIETLINKNSDYVFCKVNEANNSEIADYTLRYSVDENGNSKYLGTTLALKNGEDSSIQADDLIDAYGLFENKEEIDIDNVIGNELDGGKTAINLVTVRKDCIAFIGAYYDDVVNKKSQKAVENLVQWRKTGDLNVNSMFSVAIGNYAQIYNKYSDKNIWVNMAGMCAGLRSQTSKNYDSWWASAGLERGQLQNIIKLAFNPTQAQRDTLYKNSINPVATFPSLGTVLWGQKTLLGNASSFDRVNVRALFNTLERALAKMAKTTVMEFNDTYTRSRICSEIKPYLAQVQAGRGIQGFMVVCDESNNTPQIIANNQLVVDIYIQPTYVAEMIRLNFINSGTNSFSTETTS